MPLNQDTRAYRSKIGSLPFAVRNELCERMLDGATGVDLVKWLNAHPAARRLTARINAQNLTDWRRTGYAAWLHAREKTAQVREYAETAQHIVEAAGGDPAAVGARILAGKMLDMLEAVEAETAGDFATAVARLRKGETDAAKLDLDKQKTEIARQSLALEKDKFKRSTCEMFLKWYDNQQALSIAAGIGTQESKVQALLAFMDKEEAR